MKTPKEFKIVNNLYLYFSKDLSLLDFNNHAKILFKSRFGINLESGSNIDYLLNSNNKKSKLIKVVYNLLKTWKNNHNDIAEYYKTYLIELNNFCHGVLLKINRPTFETKSDTKLFKLISEKYKDITGDDNFNIKNALDYVIAIQKYYQHIIYHMPGNVYWMDKDCKMLGCNENTLKMVGLKSLEEFIGLTYEEVGEIAQWKEGQELSFKSDDQQVLKTKKAIRNKLEPTLYDNSGNPIYYITNRVPLFNEKNEVIGVIGISIDITNQKEAEEKEKKAIADKIVAQKEKEILAKQVESLYAMSNTVAHELRTPLNVITTTTYLMKKNITSDKNRTGSLSKLQDLINKVERQANNAQTFINIILENAKNIEDMNLYPINILPVIEAAIKDYPYSKKHHSNLINLNASNDYQISGDEHLLKHVIYNLLKNSLFFIQKNHRGEIFITLDDKDDNVILIFEDTSEGVSQDQIPHLFTNYYSNTGVGTGIGLNFCKRVINAFKGKIECESKKGDFIKFIMTFPKI